MAHNSKTALITFLVVTLTAASVGLYSFYQHYKNHPTDVPFSLIDTPSTPELSKSTSDVLKHFGHQVMKVVGLKSWRNASILASGLVGMLMIVVLLLVYYFRHMEPEHQVESDSVLSAVEGEKPSTFKIKIVVGALAIVLIGAMCVFAVFKDRRSPPVPSQREQALPKLRLAIERLECDISQQMSNLKFLVERLDKVLPSALGEKMSPADTFIKSLYDEMNLKASNPAEYRAPQKISIIVNKNYQVSFCYNSHEHKNADSTIDLKRFKFDRLNSTQLENLTQSVDSYRLLLYRDPPLFGGYFEILHSGFINDPVCL